MKRYLLLSCFVLFVLCSAVSKQAAPYPNILIKDAIIYINGEALAQKTEISDFDEIFGQRGKKRKKKRIIGYGKLVPPSLKRKYKNGISITQSSGANYATSIAIQFSNENTVKHTKKTRIPLFKGQLKIEDIVFTNNTKTDFTKQIKNGSIKSTITYVNTTPISYTYHYNGIELFAHFGAETGKLVDLRIFLSK